MWHKYLARKLKILNQIELFAITINFLNEEHLKERNI